MRGILIYSACQGLRIIYKSKFILIATYLGTKILMLSLKGDSTVLWYSLEASNSKQRIILKKAHYLDWLQSPVTKYVFLIILFDNKTI